MLIVLGIAIALAQHPPCPTGYVVAELQHSHGERHGPQDGVLGIRWGDSTLVCHRIAPSVQQQHPGFIGACGAKEFRGSYPAEWTAPAGVMLGAVYRESGNLWQAMCK